MGTIVNRCAFMYTDGPAFESYGDGDVTVTNSYFYHIDWSTADHHNIGQSLFFAGSGNEFTHNTIHKINSRKINIFQFTFGAPDIFTPTPKKRDKL